MNRHALTVRRQKLPAENRFRRDTSPVARFSVKQARKNMIIERDRTCEHNYLLFLFICFYDRYKTTAFVLV